MALDEIGVGIDIGRYEHVVQFLGPDKTPLRKPLRMPESRRGHRQLERALRELDQRFGHPLFRIVVEEANVYGRNLRAFLQSLSSHLRLVITSHNPLAAKRYKQAFHQENKNDLVDSYSEARFAVAERPPASAALDPEVETLRVMVSRLHALTKDITRGINQLRAVLSMIFPELLGPHDNVSFLLVRLLEHYPTAQALAEADVAELAAFQPKPGCKRLGKNRAQGLQAIAQHSVGCLKDPAAGEVVRGLCAQLAQAMEGRKRLQKAIKAFYVQHRPNELLSIPGIGPYTAAVLTAVIGDPHRFPTAKRLAGYLGLYPVDDESGQRKGRKAMSKKGNDLARHALFMAALSASRCNPAVRPVFARQMKRGKAPRTALGHCMRKLADLALAILKSGQPFDPHHYPWGGRTADAAQGPDESAEAHAKGRNDRPSGSQATRSSGSKTSRRSGSSASASKSPRQAPGAGAQHRPPKT